MKIPLVGALIEAAEESATALGDRVSNVRYAPLDANATVESILFDFDGIAHRGEMRGRNRDLVIGYKPDADRAIAVRVMLDGDATKLKSKRVKKCPASK